MVCKWLHKWGAPQYFYVKTAQLKIYFGIFAFVFIALGLFYGLYIAPEDYQQKDAFRIIYVHVPSALLSLSIYTIIGVNSVIYLIWRIKIADLIAVVSAPIGAGCTALALITGSIWGKPMWGTWWVWDARLTSELILLFLYFGYIGLRSAIPDITIAAKAAAILAIVGFIDVPLVHFSVQWWETLHQGATISKLARPSMPIEMLLPLIFMLIGFYLFYFTMLILFAQSEILVRERKTAWVRKTVLKFSG